MIDKKRKQHNRNVDESSRLPRWISAEIASIALLAGFLAYGVVFMLQPSLLGGVTAEGETVDRFFDLFFMPIVAMKRIGEFSLVAILERIPSILAVFAWTAIAAMWGRPFVQRSRIPLTRLEALSVAVLVGLGLLSTVTLLIGLAGGLESRWLLLGAVVVLTLTSALASRNSPQTLYVEIRRDELLPDRIPGVWFARLTPVLTVVLGAFYLLGGLLPAWEFDVVSYHMLAPKDFLQAGKIGFSGHNIYANMPLGAEMHSLAWMVLWGGDEGWWFGSLIGKGIVVSSSLFTAVLAGSFSARHCGRCIGWAVAGLLLAFPGHVHVATAGLIDAIVGAYILAAMIVLTNWWLAETEPTSSESGGSKQSNFFVPLLIALLLGAAAACKYPGLILGVVPVVPVVFLVGMRAESGWRHSVAVLAIAIGLSVTCAPWFLKNWWLTGNPVYPLVTSVFGGEGLTEDVITRWNAVHSPQLDAGRSPYSLSAAWSSSMQLLVKSPFLNPAFVFLTLCGIGSAVAVGRKSDSGILRSILLAWLALFFWILIVWWTLTHRIDRFWLPAFDIAIGFVALGICVIARRYSRSVAHGIVLLGIAWGLVAFLAGACVNDTRFFQSLPDLRAETLRDDDSVLVSPAVIWANSNLDAESERILLIGDAKAFYYEIPVVYASCFNINPGERWLREKSIDDQRQVLVEQGITHIIVDWREIERYRSPGNYGFSDWPQRPDIDALIENGVAEEIPTSMNRDAITFLRTIR